MFCAYMRPVTLVCHREYAWNATSAKSDCKSMVETSMTQQPFGLGHLTTESSAALQDHNDTTVPEYR